ncbi:MAG: tryptophanase [Deltaproteobacteria bacterium]|nr:tryptophanase [Deltaproteobacteria bacterium]
MSNAAFEPHKTKTLRHIPATTLPERQGILRTARFNTARLPARCVSLDMVTQGASAMSQEQLGGLFIGDEAYAGARNFYTLVKAVRDVLGFSHVCPTHNRRGAVKLLSSVHLRSGGVVGGNTMFPAELVAAFGGTYEGVPTGGPFGGDLDENALAAFLERHAGRVRWVYVDLQGDGAHPASHGGLERTRALCEGAGVLLVVDGSCIVEVAVHARKHDPRHQGRSVADVVRDLASTAHVLVFDAGQDAMSNVGGFIASADAIQHEHVMNEVVVFEGLHTYGGMAGRTMEVVARGLREMVQDPLAEWLDHQVDVLSGHLADRQVPFTRALNGVHLHADAFLPGTPDAAHAVACGLYLVAGVRALLEGAYMPADRLPLLIPRRAFMNSHLGDVAEAVGRLWEQRDRLVPLDRVGVAGTHAEAAFEWLVPSLEPYVLQSEPWTVHSVEGIAIRTREERLRVLKEAGYNTFLLPSEDVTIDLLTDSGTCAMSIEQWKAYLEARETPGMPDAYEDIVEAARETYGYRYVILTHQGRAAEHIMSQMFIRKGDYVPGNMYFTTTREHQEIAGGTFVDVIVDEAHDSSSSFPWKGNVDPGKMGALCARAEAEGRRVAYLSFEFNVNLAGGHPVSMDNIKQIYAFCRSKGIPVFFDATRCAENAYFIQKNDPRYADWPVARILREMFAYGDGATISSKKDPLSNLSGCLLFRDREDWYQEGQRRLQVFEGSWCSGGTSAGDMAAHAVGLHEMVQDRYIQARVEQTRELGRMLHAAGVPIVLPYGGHAIFLDARAFLDHLDQDEFPAQRLAAEIFVETGVRSMERGNVSKGRDPATGKNFRPKLELVRLTIPRRVYSADHMRMVVEGIARVYANRSSVRGLRFVYEPEKLRFFQSRFEEVGAQDSVTSEP